MHTLRTVIVIAWILFWIYWFGAARGVKAGTRPVRRIPMSALIAVAVIVLVRTVHAGSLGVHSPALGAVGAVIFVSGLLLAIWARVDLGSNWGMPMSQKTEPELVTSGPYRLVRHPIYSGLLLALLGTALVTNLVGLAVVAVVCGYFYDSAAVEERNLTAAFPEAYAAYRSRTKMLIPFVL